LQVQQQHAGPAVAAAVIAAPAVAAAPGPDDDAPAVQVSAAQPQFASAEQPFGKPVRSTKRKAAQPADASASIASPNTFALLDGNGAGTRVASPVRSQPIRTSSLSSLTSPHKKMARATSADRSSASGVSDARPPPADPAASSHGRNSKKQRADAAGSLA
jgi:hypothetical protein